jgi:alanine racemase
MSRPTEALIDLTALRHNAALARKLAGPARVMAVVKANAYGHGAEAIAQTLEPLVDALAVASIDEAMALRGAGIQCPVLLLEGVFSPDELLVAAEQNLWLCVHSEEQLQWLEQATLPSPIACWLKIDTGMHRLGIAPALYQDALARLQASNNSAAQPVVCTHFANADEPGNPHTQGQLARFEELSADYPHLRSAANSPALLAWPQARYDWVRPGYMLYGNSPFSVEVAEAAELKPVMTLRSEVIALRTIASGESAGYGSSWTATRPSTLATVTVGYGDGYPRLAPNGTPVLVNGQRGALAGRVSMDMITVDVTDLPGVTVGSGVVLWGPELPLSEVAAACGTIGYELTTRMPARARRVIHG